MLWVKSIDTFLPLNWSFVLPLIIASPLLTAPNEIQHGKFRQRHQWRLQSLLLFLSTVSSSSDVLAVTKAITLVWYWVTLLSIHTSYSSKNVLYHEKHCCNLRASEAVCTLFINNEQIFVTGSTNCTKWSQTVCCSVSSCIGQIR